MQIQSPQLHCPLPNCQSPPQGIRGKVILRSLIARLSTPVCLERSSAASLPGDAMEELQKSIIKLQDDLDVKVFRPLQKRAFDASSECCNGEKSRENFQACLEHAGRATAQAEHAVMLSLNEFQQRVQRCVVQCQDKAQSIVEAKGLDVAQGQMEKCVNECGTFYKKELAGIGSKLMKYKP